MHHPRSGILILTIKYLSVLFLIASSTSIVVAERNYGEEKSFPVKKPRKKLGSKQKYSAPFGIELFAGPAYNNASGDFLTYQETYYETGQDYLVAGGDFKNYFGVSGGLGFKYIPWWKSRNQLSELSASIGVQYYRRGFIHEFSYENFKVLPAKDLTRWKESYNSNHLAIPILFRYGSKFFIETGFAPELFLNGTMNRIIERKSFGTNPFDGGFSEKDELDYKLSGKTMKSFSLGFNAGIGYSFIEEFAIKFQVNYNTRYFKENPNLKNMQGSLLFVYTWHQ